MNLIGTFVLTLLSIFITNCQSDNSYDNQRLDGLNFTLLNKGESIKIPLDGYFPFSQDYSVYEPQSTNDINEILNITFNTDKIQNEAFIKMEYVQDNNKIDLSAYRILDVKTIYNQPNKIFLLEKNIIMMYSYRQKSQEKEFMDIYAESIFKLKYENKELQSYPKITLFNISAELNITGLKNLTLNCIETEAMPFEGSYKFIVLCKMTASAPPQTRNYIVTLNMQQDSRGFITNLKYNSSNFIENDKFLSPEAESEREEQSEEQLRAPAQNCQEYRIKYFDSLVIEQKQYFQTVIAYCNSSVDPQSIKKLFQIGFYLSKVNILIISNPTTMNITTCLINSKYVTEYENGFVSIKPRFSIQYSWDMYKYEHKINSAGKYETYCIQSQLENLYNYSFITSRNQSGVETIYVIFSYKIMIFESYSPNYQTLNINPEKLNLVSYAISNQILSLHFQDSLSENIVIKAYNIKTMYPHLIDKVEYKVAKTAGFFLFSVMNYLQKGNYFFIYERGRNLLNLTYYAGHYVNITIKDPNRAAKIEKLSLINSTIVDASTPLPANVSILPIYFKIREFCDTSIETVPIPEIKLKSKLFNVDLVKAVIGPLGRFYKMPKSNSSLQFINSFHQIDITDILTRFKGKKLMTFSINDFLNLPILTFYFEDFLFLKCGLEFDFYQMKPIISHCIQVVDSQTTGQKPEQIIIYEQEKFIQHNGSQIQFCRIQTTRDTTCVEGDFQVDLIKKIKLIKYEVIEEGLEFISVFIIFQHKFKQKDYIVKSNAIVKEDIQVLVNVEIGQNEIEYLKYMTIRTIEYDQNYDNFLLVCMMDYFNPVNLNEKNCPQDDNNFNNSTHNCSNAQNLKETYFHIVQIYAKPELKPNESSQFVGHLIEQFTSTELENVFIIDNKILLLSIQPDGSSIQEYRILDFKCIHSRDYPLYDHFITKNGSHSINSGFLFVQVEQLEQQVSKYLVYNPSLSTTNIITHSFEKVKDERIMFIQKLTPSDNVMAVHGSKLITLSLPNMVIKINQGKINPNDPNSQHYQNNVKDSNNNQFTTSTSTTLVHTTQNLTPQAHLNNVQDYYLSDSVDISFIDSNNLLKTLSFQYSYDISDSKIVYDAPQFETNFTNLSDHFEIQINPTQITGLVSEYQIKNITQLNTQLYNDKVKNICQFIEFNSSDIFTKTKCIKYFNSKEDGIMQDFLTYETGLFEDITIIVTDRKILCIQNMKIQNWTPKNKTKDCSIFQEDSRIFIVCTENSNTTMRMMEMREKCQFQVEWLHKPDFLKYNLFKMVYSRGQAIFQVPIRSETNKIYYITKFNIQNKTKPFDENSTLLKHQSQQEFITKDFTTRDTLMFLLENGLGIFNLSKQSENKKLTPDVWMSEKELMDRFGLSQELAYVNCLELNYEDKQIILEIGTTFHSFQLHVSYEVINQTISIREINVRYEYRNPWSCYNTLLSKSRYFQNMTIKMCSFMPQQHYIFSKFIPITENKQNSYIVFYQKNFQKNHSYPFRMDIIYTNIYSNDNFQIPIRKANLFIGSLFNLLCQYDLRDSYMFNFTINPKFKDFIDDNQNDVKLQKKCHFILNLSNQNSWTPHNITIKLDFESENNGYWSDWRYWIQRVFVLLIVINLIRMEYNSRAERTRMNNIKIKRSISSSLDQQFDLQVKFHSKKSL